MRRARILLVDDNRVNRKLLSAVLEADGHRVDEAGSGREAVEGVRLLPYDLVLMDIQMADMDGFAAAAAIRSLGGRPGEVPIVAITGDIDGDIPERCLAAGMNGHLAKPIALGALQQAVERWARSRIGAEANGRMAPAPAAARLGGLASHVAGAALVPIIDDFTSSAALRMADLQREAAAGDLGRVRGLAHDLSGSAANLGFMELSRVARSVEIACGGSDPEAVRRLLPETGAALGQVLALLAAQRQRVANGAEGAGARPTSAGPGAAR